MATFRLRSPRYCSVLPAVGVSRIFDKQLAAKQKSWFPDVALANSSGKITQPALRFSTLHPSGRGPRDKRRGEAEISFHTGSITTRFLCFSLSSQCLSTLDSVSLPSLPSRVPIEAATEELFPVPPSEAEIHPSLFRNVISLASHSHGGKPPQPLLFLLLSCPRIFGERSAMVERRRYQQVELQKCFDCFYYSGHSQLYRTRQAEWPFVDGCYQAKVAGPSWTRVTGT